MDLNKLSVNKIRTELWTCHVLSEQRCLRKACEWAEDLLYVLPKEGEEKLLSKLESDLNDITRDFNPKFEHAKMCFELHEYDRAAHILKDQIDDRSRFLHYFSMYKAAEKKRIDLMGDVTVNIPKKAMLKFNELRDSLERSMEKREPDGWLLYVYGLVMHKFKLQQLAIDIIVKSIHLTPNNWSAWYILTLIIDSKSQLHDLKLPDHFFKVFFYYMVRLDLDIPLHEPWILLSKKECEGFFTKYFNLSLFLKTLRARSLGYHSNRWDLAMNLFSEIRTQDPYRVDGMEIYSNLMFVRKKKEELSKLAYELEKVDPFTPEANACIANSFSAREQHTKAIIYFTRSLRLNPDLSNSWTLIGHEYLEMKSIDKALQAYRYAISITKRDCRAWLGLGNTFETIMSSPNVSSPNFETPLYYYSQVGKYRPKDQIMFMAMGSMYEKMQALDHAIICFKRAGQDGLIRLAKIYEHYDMAAEARELDARIARMS